MRLKHLLLCAALGLGACTTVGPDFKRPNAASAPSGYAGAGDREPGGPNGQAVVLGEGPAGAWWKAFGSPALDRTIRQALADNWSLASANAALAQAQEQAVIAGGNLDERLNGSIVRQQANLKAFGFDLGIPNPQFTLYSIGGTVSYDLDLFGGKRRRVEAARARVDLQRQRVDAASLALTGNVARQALTVAALNAQLRTIDAIVAEDRRTLELVRRAYALGGVARQQTVDVERELAGDLQLAPPIRVQLAAARHQLSLLVGKAPVEFTPPDLDIAGLTLPKRLPVSLPSALIRRRPDILAAEANLHAATAEIGVATAARYPNIVLNASLTQAALDPLGVFSTGNQGWSFGPTFSSVLLGSRSLAANKRAAIDAANGAVADYRQTVLTAFVQVSDVLQSLVEDAEEITAAQRSVSAAEQSVGMARLAYAAGGRDLLQLIDAQRQLTRARLALVRVQGQQYLDTAQLFVATAADWTGSPAPT